LLGWLLLNSEAPSIISDAVRGLVASSPGDPGLRCSMPLPLPLLRLISPTTSAAVHSEPVLPRDPYPGTIGSIMKGE
jgi:hypothetical protein